MANKQSKAKQGCEERQSALMKVKIRYIFVRLTVKNLLYLIEEVMLDN